MRCIFRVLVLCFSEANDIIKALRHAREYFIGGDAMRGVPNSTVVFCRALYYQGYNAF
jgi:hypothetical protein